MDAYEPAARPRHAESARSSDRRRWPAVPVFHRDELPRSTRASGGDPGGVRGGRAVRVGQATTRAGLGIPRPSWTWNAWRPSGSTARRLFIFLPAMRRRAFLAAGLADRFDAVFVDELSHYSVLEAAGSIGGPVFRFARADADDLRAVLAARLRPGQRPLVMTNGVFAARGHIAPVAEYQTVLKHYPGAALLVDDAHGLGVFGANGRGTFEHAGLDGGINIEGGSKLVCGTLSKAVGGYGGIVPGTRALVSG